ncbi:MAG: hypothetical protein PHR47_00950 [Candidatus Pacebacteria bacterium]|nr:hypothetical protein [Candidatus Paceibacterota bacterium]
MSKLKFVPNSLKEEVIISEKTQKDIEFFNKHNIIFTLPQKQIQEEYNIEKYNDFILCLKKWWTKNDDEFINKLLIFFNKPTKTEFLVKISNYGVLGSYSDKQNTITINCYIKEIDFDPIRIIKHEIIHILVQPYIETYSISHGKKESIVNSIFEILKD